MDAIVDSPSRPSTSKAGVVVESPTPTPKVVRVRKNQKNEEIIKNDDLEAGFFTNGLNQESG